MKNVKLNLLVALLLICCISLVTCSHTGDDLPVPPDEIKEEPPLDESDSRIIVDYALTKGDVMKLGKFNTHSTSSPLPSASTKEWLQGLGQSVMRTWIQVRYVYNNGNYNYNYQYAGSRVGVEDALAFYSETTDSLLVSLSAYNAINNYSLPEGDGFTALIKHLLIYYKTKFPKIKYIQVGNEPDHNNYTMDRYYPLYKHYYTALNEANAELNLSANDRLLISNGPFTSNVPNMITYARSFLDAYTEDPDPAKRLDYFSFHSYGETNRPLELRGAKKAIDAMMQDYDLPSIPVFVTEYGLAGGSTLPSGMNMDRMVTMQPSGQFTKAFYLYEGGIDGVFNWSIHHATMPQKSLLLDVERTYAAPYGYAIQLAQELSHRKTRYQAESKNINDLGLGTHVLAAANGTEGMAILVWNFYWREAPTDAAFNILVKNLPQHIYAGKVKKTIYLVDSQHNNYFLNDAHTSLKVYSEELLQSQAHLKIPLVLGPEAVALILLRPE